MEDQAGVVNTSVEKENALMLSMQFGVLRKILCNLPAKDLGRAALVCHAWNDVCRILRRERQSVHWFEWHSPKVGGKWTLQSPRSKINEEFGQIFCEPHVCLFFSSERINSIIYEEEEGKEVCAKKAKLHPTLCSSSLAEKWPSVIGHLIKMLPITCSTLGLRAYGTVGTPLDLSQTVELRNKASFSVLILPKITGVHVNQFAVEREAFMKVKSAKLKKGLLSDEQLEELTGITPTEKVRCLIVFCDSTEGEEVAELVILSLLKRMNYKMAVGGGIGDQFISNNPHSGPLLTGLAISGDSVRAASAVIPQNFTALYKINAVMEQLRSCGIPTENCFGFMFTCMGRSVGRPKGVRGTESSLFRSHFPTVPLLGFFGSGEIGVNFTLHSELQENCECVFGENDKQLLKKDKLNKTGLMHQYSTIIVMVSLRKGKKSELCSDRLS